MSVLSFQDVFFIAFFYKMFPILPTKDKEGEGSAICSELKIVLN